jgi:hypothetical protein
MLKDVALGPSEAKHMVEAMLKVVTASRAFILFLERCCCAQASWKFYVSATFRVFRAGSFRILRIAVFRDY